MASAHPIAFADLMPKVAPLLCGKPNERMSKGTRLRFGTHGSLEVDTAEGWFDDHESKAKGGVLDLIQHRRGCTKREALCWLEDQGLKDRQEMPVEPRGRIFYDYVDQDGVVAYRIERRGKDHVPPFLQHGPDGKGGFRAGQGCMQGVPRLPYRLPELLASDPNQVVFIVEGEKDADRLARDGLIATTNSGGAGKFGAELVPWFEGRRVVVIPDNDQPGEDHATDVAAKLGPVAAAVAVVKLPGLPPKGDVSDWLSTGGSTDHLVTRLAEPALAKADEPPETFPLIDLTWWAATSPTPRTFEIERAIPAGEVTLATGPGGVGKSLFLQQASTCFVAQMPCVGLNTSGGVALYVTAEDDDRELHWRQDHICRALRVPMQSLIGKLFLVTLRGRLNNELVTFDREGRAQVTDAFRTLKTTIQATKAKLVTLDNVAHLFAGNENDRQQVTAFANVLASLCRDHGCTIVLVGHPNKAGDDYSGSTAWPNAVRSHITLKRPDDEGADPDARVLALGKANYAQAGEMASFRWHNFAFVRDGDLAPSVAAEIAVTIAATAGNTAFLRCLAVRNEQRRHVSEKPTASNYAPRQFEHMPEAKGLSKRKLEAAMDRLFRIHAIERGFLYRDTGEGKDIYGLRAVPESSPESSRKHLPIGSGNPQESTGNTVSYTTYNSGADPEGPSAPDGRNDLSNLALVMERLNPTDPFAPDDEA